MIYHALNVGIDHGMTKKIVQDEHDVMKKGVERFDDEVNVNRIDPDDDETTGLKICIFLGILVLVSGMHHVFRV